MSALNAQQTSPFPSTRALDALRLALRAHVEGLPAASDDSLRVPARLMCEDARVRSAQIEHLLIALKQTWPAVVEAQGVPRAHSASLLARLVTLCVQEFYAPLG